MNPLRRLRRAARAAARWRADVRLYRRARRRYRELCNMGYGAAVRFEIRLVSEEWTTGLPSGSNLTGLKTTIPLTRQGKRYIAGVVRDIESTCIRAIMHDLRKEEQS